MTVLWGLVLVILALFLVAAGYRQLLLAENVGEPEPLEHTITVEGQARVQLTPDIATVNIGVETLRGTTAEAQQENTRVMDAMMDRLRAAGISDDDIQTAAYNVYEKKEYNPDTRTSESVGWVVNQSLTVTIRDIDKVSTVIGIAGQNGATSVNGPNFAIDDPFAQRENAREAAILNARKAAEDLAAKLDIDLERVVGYNEWMAGDSPQPRYYALEAIADGFGGAAPEIAPGEEELTLHVSLTFTIE